MSAFVASRRELDFELTGKKISVANDATARCMYYLSCVFAVVQLDTSELSRLKNYDNYYSLSLNEKKVLLKLCEELDPSSLMRIGIFHKVDNLPDNSGNEFVKITSTNTTVYADQTFLIGGHQVKAMKIMFCTQSWLNAYYYNPVRDLRNQISNVQQPIHIPLYNPPRVGPSSSGGSYSSSSSDDDDKSLSTCCKCCACCCCCLIVIAVIVVIVVLVA